MVQVRRPAQSIAQHLLVRRREICTRGIARTRRDAASTDLRRGSRGTVVPVAGTGARADAAAIAIVGRAAVAVHGFLKVFDLAFEELDLFCTVAHVSAW